MSASLRKVVAAAVMLLGLLLGAAAHAQDELADAMRMSQRAVELYGQGKYADAIDLLQQVLVIQERVVGPEDRRTTRTLSNLASLYASTGQYDKALALFQRALASVEKTLGPEHPDTASILNNLSDLYGSTGQYDKAQAAATRALAIREKVLGPEHPHTAVSLNNLATLYYLTGRYQLALPLYQRAQTINEKALGPEHPDTAAGLNNLAELYRLTGQFGQAFALQQRALAIREKALGPVHPAVAISLNNLAGLYDTTGQYDKALPLYQRALAITEKTVGPDHRDTARGLNNLASLYQRTGRSDLALPLYQRALAIHEKALGPEHADTARSLNNLASLYYATGQFGPALPLYQRALAIFEKALGPDHPNTAGSLNNLGELYFAMGQYDQALPLYQRALAILEKAYGPEHPDTATSLNNLALLYRAMGRRDQALPYYERALAIKLKTLGPRHPDVAASLNNVAALYEAAGQYDQALAIYERSLAIKQEVLGPEHPDTALSLSNLAGLHVAVGRDDQAVPLYQRALLIAQSANSPAVVWTASGSLMALYAPVKPAAGRSTNIPLAIWHGKQALHALQSVRTGLRNVDAEMQSSFLKSKEWYYTRLAELLVQQGRIPEAEQVLSMLKERELSDLVHRSEVRKTQADDVGVERTVSRQSAEFAERGVKYSSELAALERKARLEPLTPAESARKDELLKAAEAWRAEYQRWLGGLGAVFTQSGRTRQEAQAEAQAGTKLQTLVRAEPGAVGLHYIVTDERIAIIVATARGSFGRFSEVKREELNRQIAALRQAIVGRTDALPAAQALHRMLIEPVAKDLDEANASTLVLSLTDTLRYVPFAALHDGKSFLVERHPLALYASAGGASPKTSSQAWQVAGLGLTQSRLGYNALPAVKGELDGIVRTTQTPHGVLPGRISLDQAFDKAQLEEALTGRYSVVHVASHFSFTPGDESRSVLLPGAGEPISLGQLAVMDFSHVQQLTLSACETATGGGVNENGAEVEGLAAAVQAQGAQAVLASLWKVADASTAQLMQRFYAQRTQGQTVTRAIALQQAQLALLRGSAKDGAGAGAEERGAKREGPAGTSAAPMAIDPAKPYAHPFYWAPFVLSGNWL